MSNNDFHSDLKEQTKSLHTSLEQLYLTKSLVEGTITKAEYEDYLQRLYCIHHSIEGQLERFDWKKAGIDLKKYLRKHLLEKDLNTLGLQPETKECKDLQITDFNHAFGVLYVLTGSTMGGKILAHKVSQSPDLLEANSYFNAFGDNTMALWMEFMQKFTQYVQTKGVEQEMINAAKSCYRYVGEVLDG